jgi:hypothetical protein
MRSCVDTGNQGKAEVGVEAAVGLMWSRPLCLFCASRDRASTNCQLLLEDVDEFSPLRNLHLQGKEAVSRPWGDCGHPLSVD